LKANLESKIIIVTRPLSQAQDLMLQLESCLATVIHFPTISISAADNLETAKQCFNKLDQYQTIIFVSANAVHFAVNTINELGKNFSGSNLAAVGPATKAAIECYGYKVKIVPKYDFNSEALLQDSALTNVSGQNILIVRGQGGREHLRQVLESRGANVNYAEIYQRKLPDHRNPTDLSQLPKKNTVILLHSVESAQNLWSLCTSDEQQWLAGVTVIVGSKRIADAVARVGFANNLIIAENPSDQAMREAISNWSITL
jgi:uroporphyrinogen-III synthase